MEVSSTQLAQAVAAARIALAEAFVLKVGQTLQAIVAGRGSDGLTLLKIGDQVVKAALPEMLPAGTTLQLQVKSAGPTPQLAIVAQKLPPDAGAVDAMTAGSRPQSGPMPAQPVVTRQPTAPQNGEQSSAVIPAASRTESGEGAQRLTLQAPPTPATPPPIASAAQVPRPQVPAAMAAAGDAELPAPPAGPTTARSSGPADAQETVAPSAAVTREAPSIAPATTGPARLVPSPPSAAALPARPPEPSGGTAPTVPASTPAPAPAAEAKSAASPPGVTPTAAPTTDPNAPKPLHPLLVAQVASRPPATAAELPRPVAAPAPVQQGVAPAPSPPLPATPQAALAQMLPAALARQDSVAPLMQSLAELVQQPALLPEPVRRAALGVLAQRVIATSGKVQPADIERAVRQSGLALEATLAKGEPPEPLDAKAGLLALRAALTKWLGGAPAPLAQPRDTAPPPLKGLPLRAPDPNPPPLADAPRDALRAVHGQADAAVSRLKLMQMASLPDADPGRPAPAALRLEMPLLIGHELVMAQLQISRDGARRETERRRGWTMRFALNYSATGEVGAEVGLLGKVVNVALWAAERETAEAMQGALPQLGGALEAIGLKPGALRVREGIPGPERGPSGRLVDNMS